jgi:hypothetical protein
MARLFDSGSVAREEAQARQSRVETRRRAEEAEQAMKELQETDEASMRLRERLSEVQSVAPIRYEEYRPRGSKWLVEHSKVGDDYIFQLHPLKPPTVGVQDVLALAITAMDVIFPRSLEIRYVPPSQQLQLKFYTIKVEKVVGVPGWKGAIERALAALASMDAWPKRETA